jgi:hypothetical protein
VGTGAFLGGVYSVKEVVAFGGIEDASARGIRSSERIRAQPNADLSQLERAQQQASARDPSHYSGTKISPHFTIASFSDEVILSRANKVGVSLGNSNGQISESIKLLKETDVARTLFMLKRKEENLSEKEEFHITNLIDEADKLCDDLAEENDFLTEDHKETLIFPKKPVKINKRKPKEVKVATRHSARLRKKLI